MGYQKTAIAPSVQMPPGCDTRTLPFKIGSGRNLASIPNFQIPPPTADGVFATDPSETRIRMRVFYRHSDSHLIGKVWFGDGAEGPPGHVHGGASAYVLDEAMGSVGWMNHLPILAAHLDFDYLRPTPLMCDLTLEAWLGPIVGRRVEIRSRLLAGDQTCVEGHGEFAIIARSKISNLADPTDPEVIRILNDPKIRWAHE